MTKNYLYNLLFSVSNILFPIVTFPYVSRVLGPEGIGKVQFVVSFAQYFTLIAALGIPVYGIQAIATSRASNETLSKTFSELLLIYLFTSTLLSLLYFSAVLSFAFFQEDLQMFLFGGLLVLFSFTSIDWLFVGLEEFRSLAFRSVAVKFLSLLLLFAFIHSQSDYSRYLLIVLFTIQGTHFFNLLMSRRKVALNFSGLNLKKHIKPIIFIFGSTVAASMYTVLDTVLLGLLADAYAVGLYTAASKLSRVAIPFIISMGATIVPIVAFHFKEDNLLKADELFVRTFSFLCFFAVPVSVGLGLLSNEFVMVFSGEEFQAADISMVILCLLPVLVGFGHFFAFVILIPAGFHKDVLISSVIGLALSIGLNFILVPTFREVGASIATVSTELVVTLCCFSFFRRRFKISLQWRLLLQALVCSAVFLPIVWLTKAVAYSNVLTLLISVPLCFLCYMLLQWFIFRNFMVGDFLRKIKLRFWAN